MTPARTMHLSGPARAVVPVHGSSSGGQRPSSLRPPWLRALLGFFGACQPRSADFQSAVSQISNLRRPGTSNGFEGSAPQPTGSRRYSRLKICATSLRQRRLGGLLALALLSSVPVGAQPTNALFETNGLPDTNAFSEVDNAGLTNGLPPMDEFVQTNDFMQTNDLTRSNESAAPAISGAEILSRPQTAGRSANDNRGYRRRDDSRRRSDQPDALASDNGAQGGGRTLANTATRPGNGPIQLDFSAFRIIADRNIFDPNRQPNRRFIRGNGPPRTTESFSLVGIMSYEKGTFAFFDGTSSDYRKALQLAGAIADYKITSIAPDSVKLASSTNELELRVGMQLRRQDDGGWSLTSQSETYAASATSSAPNHAEAPSSDAESDIIKKLMQRREQE